VSVADYVATELKEKLKDVQFARFSDPRARVKAILGEVLLSVLDKAGRLDIFELVEAKENAGEPAIIVFVGINGTGKTTSIASLLTFSRKRQDLHIGCERHIPFGVNRAA